MGGNKMFKMVTAESVGISSENVLNFIKILDDCRLRNHSIIMAKGDEIFAEGYYKPFHKDYLHRMYSVSKTFVAIAIGLAVTEGLVSLDDAVIDYFPEFRNEKTDEYYEECTIRDMLCMNSNIGTFAAWWGIYKGRVEAYYDQKTDKIPGTVYWYDSIGSFLLGCIIERLTNKTFLDYLKDKILLEIGFSKDSYTLTEPGGYTVGDSGIMCTARDLLLFARFIMKKGEWNGKQYIDRKFMEDAVKIQSINDLDGMGKHCGNQGYGYLIWKTHPDGYSLIGAGEQLAVCDEKNDLCFVITSDNQGDTAARRIIFHEFYYHFLPKVQKMPLPENSEAAKALKAYMDNASLLCQYGKNTSAWAEKISGVTYVMNDNPLGVSWFKLDLQKNVLEFEKDGKTLELAFTVGENKIDAFSFGDRAVADRMGFREPGQYTCANSGAWVSENQFSILAQVIDTYFGGVYISIAFKDERATFYLNHTGQYVFTDEKGYAIGRRK